MKKYILITLLSLSFINLFISCDDEDFNLANLFKKKQETETVQEDIEIIEEKEIKYYSIGEYRDINPNEIQPLYSDIPNEIPVENSTDDIIIAKPEILKEIECGFGENQLFYKVDFKNPDFMNIPRGPALTKTGKLVFYYEKDSSYIYNFEDNNWSSEQISDDYLYGKEKYFIISNQNGFKNSIDKKYFNLLNIDFSKFPENINDNDLVYDVPFGIVVERYNQNVFEKVFAYDFTDIKNPAYYNTDKINEWLSAQEDNFSYKNNCLYKNEQPWSIKPTNINGKFIGKLKSGHNIIKDENKLIITNGNSQVEKQLLLTWEYTANADLQNGYRPDTYSLGPWGEIYCLIGPRYYEQDFDYKQNLKSQLTLIRNHLKYFGITLFNKTVLYSQPNLVSKVINSYDKDTGFSILGFTESDEKLFVNVRLLDGTTGYFIADEIKDLYEGNENIFPSSNKSPWNYVLKDISTAPEFFKYKEIEGQNGNLIITGYKDNIPSDVIIPSEINGKKIAALSDNVFENSKIISITLPDTISEIPVNAFYNCSQLKSINMGNSIKVISSNAFENCTSLNEIKFSKKLEKICTGSFKNCKNLKEINLEKNQTKDNLILDAASFEDCSLLHIINLPDNTKIAENAFLHCSSIAPELLNSIKEKMYYHD